MFVISRCFYLKFKACVLGHSWNISGYSWLLLKLLFISDVSSVPASCDSTAVSLWPLHRAGGEIVEERGLIPGAKPAGSVHQFQTHSVQLLET